MTGKDDLLTLLIADDEFELRRGLARATDWESIGFRVVGVAENGAEAMDMVELLHPDVLLTDIRMPFIDGIELARRVNELYPRTGIVFLSGYDDFEYARQGIKYNVLAYLLKPLSRDSLRHEMQAVKAKLKQRDEAFRQATDRQQTGQIESQTEAGLLALMLDATVSPFVFQERERLRYQDARRLQDRLKTLGFPVPDEPEEGVGWQLFVLHLMDEQGRNITEREHLNSMELVLEKHPPHLSFYSRSKLITLFFGAVDELYDAVQPALDDVTQNFASLLSVQVVAGLSKPYQGLEILHVGLGEALENALESHLEAPRLPIQIGFPPADEGTESTDRMDQYLRDLPQLIKLDDRTALTSALDELFRLFYREIDARPPGERRLWGKRLTVSVLSAIYHAMGFDSLTLGARSEVFDRLAFSSLIKDVSLADLQGELTEILLKIRDELQRERKDRGDHVTTEVYRLIYEGYQDPDLSLGGISRALHISPGYLSSLIRKRYKETFSKLLNKRRMEVAYDLVVNTDRRMADIAEACGYSDQHYFSYCFKKQYDRSPNILRREQKAAEEQKP